VFTPYPARFSVRYHHTNDGLDAQLAALRQHPAGGRTIVLIGDSFVAGLEVDPTERFTTQVRARLAGTRLIALACPSYSPIVYERLYRDVALPLHPDVVAVCLDQTDAGDDAEYAQFLDPDWSGDPERKWFDAPFKDTSIAILEAHPVRYFLLQHSRIYLYVARHFVRGLDPVPERTSQMAKEHRRVYADGCAQPSLLGDQYAVSEKYIEEIIRERPPAQQLYFITYPHAQNLAGQPKSTLLQGLLPDRHQSVPVYEYWITRNHLAQRHPEIHFIHTAQDFRDECARTPRALYFHENDIHWNAEGHRFFASLMNRYLP